MKLTPVTTTENSKTISFTVEPSLSHNLDEFVSEIIRLSKLHDFLHKNLRFCFHELGTYNLHQMLILERREQYYPPHVHSNRDEMHIVLFGSLEVFILNPNGSYLSSYISSASSNSFSSVLANQPHLTRPHTEQVVYLEIKDGAHTSFKEECFTPDSKLGCSMSYMNYLSSHLFKSP